MIAKYSRNIVAKIDASDTSQLLLVLGGGTVLLSDLIKGVGPSELDREIQLLNSKEQCRGLLKFILIKLKKGEDFEIVESYLSLYLKVYASDL